MRRYLAHQLADLDQRVRDGQVLDAGPTAQQPTADGQRQFLLGACRRVLGEAEKVGHAAERVGVQLLVDFRLQWLELFLQGRLA